MANVLVVANDTHGGRKLIEAIQARAAAGDARFYVIAPQNKPLSGLVIYDEAVRDAASHRVEATRSALREVGIEAQGEVMDPDPFNATLDAVREYGIHEIIVSTHPATRSGWLRRDLIERVHEATGLPVTHVVVDLDADRDETTHTLVVANETAAGEPLFAALRRRAETTPHRFTVIVPQSGGDGNHTEEARERLNALLDHLHASGIPATGSIGDPDPFTAVMNALQFYRVDEIVISTHPATRSGWLRSNLVDRVQRATAAPVEHVVSDLTAATTTANDDETRAA
jgi:hypothetical protein